MKLKYKREIGKYLFFNEKVKEWTIEFFSGSIHIHIVRYDDSELKLREELIGIDKIIKMLDNYI